MANAAPVSCPTIVTRLGSPPNGEILSFVHCKAAIISIRPKFPPDPGEFEARVFINPLRETKRNERKEKKIKYHFVMMG